MKRLIILFTMVSALYSCDFIYPIKGIKNTEALLETLQGISLDQEFEVESNPDASSYAFKIVDENGDENIFTTTRNSFSLSNFDFFPNPRERYELSYQVEFKGRKTRWQYIGTVSIDGSSMNLGCLTDQIFLMEAKEDPSLMQLHEQTVAENLEKVKEIVAKRKSSKSSGCTVSYTIPVVFHIVYDPLVNGAKDISLSDIQASLNKLNADFAGTTNTCIEFCFAQTGMTWTNTLPGAGGAPTPGVTRTANSTYTYVTSTPWSVHPESVIGLPTDQFMNVWIVENIDFAAGFAAYPPTGGPKDGIVIRDEHINGSESILTHEAGHFLTLLHPWGINGTSCNVLSTYGYSDYPLYGGQEHPFDHISDTPPQSGPTSYFGSITPIPACISGTFTDPLDYMDYSDFTQMDHFTQGQADYMHAALQTRLPRQNLVKMSNLLNLGVAGPGGCIPVGLSTDFSMTPTSQLCRNSSTMNLSAVASTTSYASWNFSVEDPLGAVTNYSSSGPSVPNVSAIGPFSTLGVYDITLTVMDASGNQSTSAPSQFFVVDCNGPNTNQWSDWYFGDGATLDFSGATAAPNPPSAMTLTQGGSASISDPVTNDLNFYTNGKDIWDRTHNIMQGGANIGGTQQAKNGVLIVPHPDPSKPKQYFVFYNGIKPGTLAGVVRGLRWALVDMDPATNGGFMNGAVISVDQPVPGMPWYIADYITAIPHENGTDYWILTQRMENGFNDELYAYLLTSSGITATPVQLVQSTVRSVYPQPGLPAYTLSSGAIEATRDGNRIAIANASNQWSPYGSAAIVVYRFDRCTGIVDHARDLGAPTHSFNYTSLSFSPSGEMLYAYGISKSIQQYDLRELDKCGPIPMHDFPFSHIYNPSVYNGGGMQLGPDDRLYICHLNGDKISVINFPDVPISATNLNAFGANMGAIQLNQGAHGEMCMPNIIDALTDPPVIDFEYCIDNCNVVSFHGLGCGASYSWDFDHASSTASIKDPTYTYPATGGNFDVTFTVGNQSVTKTISINTSPTPSIVTYQAVCSGAGPITYTIDPDPTINYPGATYNWTVWGGTQLSPSTSQDMIVEWLGSTGYLQVVITDANGCVLQATKSEVINTPPTISIVSNPGVSNCAGICDGEVTVSASGGTAPYTYNWNDPNQQTGATATNLCVGQYTVFVRDANDCESSLQITVNEPVLTPQIVSQTNVSCFGGNDGSATITAQGGTLPLAFQWQGGGSSDTQTGLSAGIYNFVIEDANGCMTTGQVTITEPQLLVATATAICGGDAQVAVTGGTAPYSYVWNNNPALNTPVINLSPGFHTVNVTDANGCASSSSVTVVHPSNSINLPYQYSGRGVDKASDLYHDAYGNTYIAYTVEDDVDSHGTYFPGTGCPMTVVEKLDDCEQLIWQYQLPMCATIGEGRDVMFVDSNENLFLQAQVIEYFQWPTYFGSSGLSQYNYHIFQFDPFGNPVKADDVSDDRQELTTNTFGHVITLRNQGDFNSLGDANSFPTNLMHYQISGYHNSQDIITDVNDDLIVTGLVDNTLGTSSYNLNVSKYNGLTGFANLLWRQSFPASKFEEIKDAATLSNGDIIIVGNSRNGFSLSGTNIAAGGAFVMSLSRVNGSPLWVYPLTNAEAQAVAVGLLNEIYVAGNVLNASGEFFLLQLDVSGLVQDNFVSDPNPTGEVRVMDLAVKNNGQIYISGHISDDVMIANNLLSTMHPPADRDIVLIRMQNVLGSLAYARAEGELVDNELELTSVPIVYPNPARNTIWLDIAEGSSNIDIEIYDLTGQVVRKSFLNDSSEPINVSQLKPGVYMIRGRSGSESFEERFLKI